MRANKVNATQCCVDNVMQTSNAAQENFWWQNRLDRARLLLVFFTKQPETTGVLRTGAHCPVRTKSRLTYPVMNAISLDSSALHDCWGRSFRWLHTPTRLKVTSQLDSTFWKLWACTLQIYMGLAFFAEVMLRRDSEVHGWDKLFVRTWSPTAVLSQKFQEEGNIDCQCIAVAISSTTRKDGRKSFSLKCLYTSHRFPLLSREGHTSDETRAMHSDKALTCRRRHLGCRWPPPDSSICFHRCGFATCPTACHTQPGMSPCRTARPGWLLGPHLQISKRRKAPL